LGFTKCGISFPSFYYFFAKKDSFSEFGGVRQRNVVKNNAYFWFYYKKRLHLPRRFTTAGENHLPPFSAMTTLSERHVLVSRRKR
jgi:hypothetical protein